MPPCSLRIRGFPALTCLMLSESRCLPFDPEILSDRRGGTPICQNSVLLLPPSCKHQPRPSLRINPRSRHFLREGAENKIHLEQQERNGMGSIMGRKLVMCYRKSNIYLLLRTCRSTLRALVYPGG